MTQIQRRSISILSVLAGGALVAGLAMYFAAAPPTQAQAPKGPGGKGSAGGAPPAPKVLVTPALTADVSEQRSFVGTAWPIRKSLVGSAAPGRVEKFLINAGDFVQAGQEIAMLRTGIIQAELDAAQGLLKVREAELAQLNVSLQDEIEQSAAQVEHAQAVVKFRQAKVERSRQLGSSIAREILEEDTSLYIQAAAELREAQAALRLLTEGARQQKTKVAEAWVESQKAEVQRLSEQLDRHTMRAPFDGFVSVEETEIGQWVMQGDPIAEILELGQVDIEIPVLEDYVAQLAIGQEVEVEIPSLGGRMFVGKVAIINPQADARARTFPVKIRVDNEFVESQPLIRAGMFARVRLSVGQPLPRVMVPKDAVVLGGPAPMVFIADASSGKPTVRPAPVKLGPAQGVWIAVEGGPQAGDSIIVEGNERVRPGQEVRPETKEMSFP
jgi:RND family efflux transporter MFP subunit